LWQYAAGVGRILETAELTMADRLDGKVAIVTGAGRGAGAAIALALAAAGASVAANDINPDRAEATARAIREAGGTALAIDADVSNRFHCVKLIEGTRARWGRLDILVNQAHVSPAATVLEMDEWDWDRCLDVNLKGTFFMSQLVGRVMADENGERGGSIVNVVSMASMEPAGEQQAAFAASQAAVVAFARECAVEFADYGIRVNTVIGAATGAEASHAETIGAVLFFCSEGSRELSGTSFRVSVVGSR
jgi:3-oxoacyl-[acyl-carrier protein] reductase